MDLSALPVVDGHCHPLFPDPWTVAAGTFLDRLTEGAPGTMHAHVPHTGYYRRTVGELARRLRVAPTLDAVLAARSEQTAIAMFREANVEALLVDTGYPASGGMPLSAMGRLLSCAVHEVFRIETCAQRLVARGSSYEKFRHAFEEELTAAAARCVSFKTIVAYRSGLEVRPWPEADVAAAYRTAVGRVANGTVRLVEKPLLDTLVLATVAVARRTRRPIQIHSGFGDPDVHLPLANPTLLRAVLEDPANADAPLVLLHMSYPYVREAAYLTAVWPQVYLDLSLALPFLGPGAVAPLTELLALAPASKLMYGSDVSALPELFALSAEWGREALAEALDALHARGDFSEAEAHAAAGMILAGNARALYGI